MSISRNLATGLATLAVGLGGGAGLAARTSTESPLHQQPAAPVLVHHADSVQLHDPRHEKHQPECAKHLTVVSTVGTPTGAVASLSNGCWSTIDADGAANPKFRKCSSLNDEVHNPRAPNFAMDDMNPLEETADRALLSRCSAHATGIGFEYMADRGSWLLVPEPHIKAYFAELYSSDQTVDDAISAWQTRIAGHTVSPMINIGPTDPQAIHQGALEMCKRVGDGGYFGIYDSDWQGGMNSADPRAQAVASALNACTK